VILLKVLFLISGGDSGGAKTHLFALLDSLKHKCEVRMVCFMEGVFYQEILERDVETVLLKQKNRFDMSVVSEIERMVKEEGFDIVHCHGARANFIISKIKKRLSVPVITTVHSDYLLDFDGIYKKVIFTGLNMYALRNMDHYIAVSTSFKRMLVKRNFAPNDIYTVYNGMNFDEAISYDEKEDFFKRINYTPDEGEVRVGIIGRHDYVKGHDIFMKGAALVARKYKNVKFFIAGTGDGEAALREMAKKEGIADRVVFCGFIKDIYSFINILDINTITSRSESFPYVMLEGARLKKPMVASDVGGISDLVEDNKTGLLFEAEDYEGFAEKLSLLIENSDLRKQMGEALYDRATSVFSSENLALEHIRIYESVLKRAKETKKYDIVLSGYYGFNNIGDDALLFSILENIRRIKPDTRFLILTKKPKRGREVCLVDTLHRFHPIKLFQVLKKSKMLLSGGGSLIQDATSAKSLYYYLFVMNVAKKLGCKVFAYANGIGPVKQEHVKMVNAVLKKADKITLRESMSAAEIKRICPEVPFEVTADPAIGLKVKNNKLFDILEKEGIESKNLLGISVRAWSENDKNFIEKMAEVIKKAVKNYSLYPVFIPMKYPGDVKISKELCAAVGEGYVIENQYDVDDVVSFVSSCRLVLGMRLHTLIFSAGNGIPCIGISYDPKIDGFMKYVGIDKFLNAADFDAEKAVGYVDEIMGNYESECAAIAHKSEELSNLAFKNAEIAVEMLDEVN